MQERCLSFVSLVKVLPRTWALPIQIEALAQALKGAPPPYVFPEGGWRPSSKVIFGFMVLVWYFENHSASKS
jgi:hypothetical protein